MRKLFILVCFLSAALLATPVVNAAGMKVATLHPLLTDLAQRVGGEHVEVVSLLRAGADPHEFDPSPGDLARIRDARLILASGKELETYLPRLKSNLQGGQEIFEVGRNIPSLRIEHGPLYVCCPVHAHGSLDPHWWHSVSNMQRAARLLARELGRIDGANKDAYTAKAQAYSRQLDGLRDWARSELAQVARKDRILVTAHAAFGYFCDEFGFRSAPVQGLNAESNPSPAYLAETIGVIRDNNVKAIFPEQSANPRVLESMVRETGVKTGKPLIADGTGTGSAGTFEGMIRHNVSAIVEALK